jgi:phospholipid/cholesterol/gamma-HCH transport system ATP-binding protein
VSSEGPPVLLELAGVAKRFGRKVVLDGLDLEVRRGETLAVVGRSGVGKSVLLKLILGLARPDRGRIVIGGEDITRLGERELRPVRMRMGMVFQGGALFDSLSVFENVAYGLVEHGWPADRIGARVRECLGWVDLGATERLLPEQLSGGMRKRIAIARAVAPEPEVMLYDEPTTGLDPQTARTITELIRALADRLQVTALVVTHDMECVYAAADRIALLEGGKVSWTGDAREAAEAPPEPLRRFLGEDASWSNAEILP